MIQFSCPTCQAKLLAPDTTAGTKVICQKCKQKLLVPGPPIPAPQPKTMMGKLEKILPGPPKAMPVALATSLPAQPPSPAGVRRWMIVAGGISGAVVLMLLIILVIVLQLGKGPAQTAVNGGTPTQPDGGGLDQLPGSGKKSEPPAGDAKTEESGLSRFVALNKVEGFDRLAKVKVFKLQGKSKFSVAPNVNDISVVWHSNSNFKYVEQLNNGFQQANISFVMKGDDGWAKTIGFTTQGLETLGPNFQQVSGKILHHFQNFSYGFVFNNLALLKQKEKEFEFRSAGDHDINGRQCFSVGVTRKGSPEMIYFFDKQTSQVTKIQYKTEYNLVDQYYSDYRKTDGAVYWGKLNIYHNGAHYAEVEVHSITFLNDFDERLFALD